jgi:hypothetical protein
MGVLKKARQALRQASPAWLNVEVNQDFFQNFQEALKPVPQGETVEASLQGRPHWRRISAVYAALDQFWMTKGVATYDRLISHVAEVTGQKCSRKLISKWKLERGLR